MAAGCMEEKEWIKWACWYLDQDRVGPSGIPLWIVKKDIKTEEDLSKYYHKYTEITQYLINKKKITSDYVMKELMFLMSERFQMARSRGAKRGVVQLSGGKEATRVAQELAEINCWLGEHGPAEGRVREEAAATQQSEGGAHLFVVKEQELNLVSTQMVMTARIKEVVSDDKEEKEVWVA
ncbi:hypothetical protein PISMIDRAFT_24502 [Pisolithus microcarpus 441]|uniref:Uncharacterized protein n=1 Tax=Pisolithus microcarpus 441 TaxID=765257 RepID=A0A0C9ZGN0_9AGAM|nr:hypothetical protein PISMIDRAFT_24502 [Pisolithus microcarpus 441]